MEECLLAVIFSKSAVGEYNDKLHSNFTGFLWITWEVFGDRDLNICI